MPFPFIFLDSSSSTGITPLKVHNLFMVRLVFSQITNHWSLCSVGGEQGGSCRLAKSDPTTPGMLWDFWGGWVTMAKTHSMIRRQIDDSPQLRGRGRGHGSLVYTYMFERHFSLTCLCEASQDIYLTGFEIRCCPIY